MSHPSIDINLMNSLDWRHIIELAPGISTPGIWSGEHIRSFIDKAQLDFSGAKVLDIGCFDGLWSFEAEKRGASEIWAVDDILKRPGDDRTFRFAHRALNSKVNYDPHMTVYRLDTLGRKDFDVVLFLGLIYHLVHPLLGLGKARCALKEGGHFLLESDVIDDEQECYATFHYRDHHVGDRSNWFTPTTRCLLEMLECSYLDVVTYDIGRSGRSVVKDALKRLIGRRTKRIGRICVLARAVRREDPNWIRPDELLHRFDCRWEAVDKMDAITV